MTGDILLRELTTDDAIELIALFRSCYGESYGTSTFYDADELCQRITDKTLRAVVAIQGGRLVGHMAMTIRHPESKVCETGNTVVHPDARGQGLLGLLGKALHERVVRDGFVGTANYPTTAHQIMQRAATAGGGIETGVMLAYVAAHTQYEGMERKAGRVAATVVYQPIAPPPHREVIVPSRYRDAIKDLYARLNFKRTKSSPSPGGLIADQAYVDIHYNERRGSSHAFVRDPGANLGTMIADHVRLHQPHVTYIDLPLDDPHIDTTIDALRDVGFHYCALMPEYAHTDVLRLQALHMATPEDYEPELTNPDAQRLCAYIRNDAPAQR